MARSRVLILIFLFSIAIGTAKGRWLEVSDGVHDIGNTNAPFPFLRMRAPDSGRRCKSIYGFMPCADTVLESVFLIGMYTYALMLAEEWLHKGSAALLMQFSNRKIAGSVFRVLMALPRIVIVIVSGALCTQDDARNQVGFGVAMYAGSTIISLTGIWGVNVILNKEKLRQSVDDQDLSFFKDVGVRIKDDTRKMAFFLLLSLIPLASVLLVQVFTGRMMILSSVIISWLSFLSYVLYQIANPWIQARSVAYLKQERFQKVFLKKLQGLTNINLYIEGKPNMEAIKSIFKLVDADDGGHLTLEELKNFIHEKLISEGDEMSKVYALQEIIRHFDRDGNKALTSEEFEEGCTIWLNKWNGAMNDLSISQTICEKFVADNNIEELAVMPKALFHPLINNNIVNEKGEIEEKQIKELFDSYDKDDDGEINYGELKEAIARMNLAIHDPGMFAQSIINDFDTDKSGRINKEEVITGVKKWAKMAKEHTSGTNDLRAIIQRFANEAWGLSNTKEEPKTNILYAALGAATIYLFAGSFMQSVIQFSNALNIPFLFTSFVVAPFFMNARSMVIFAFSSSRRANSNKDGSLAFFELYGGLVMNNLMGLTTLLTIVYIRDLRWIYTAEVIAIIVVGLIMGTFALIRQTYPLWASFLSFFLYVTTTIIFCVYAWGRA